MFDLPHAELHAALLPYTAAFLLPAAPEAGRRIAAALGADDAAAAITRSPAMPAHRARSRARPDRGRRRARGRGRGPDVPDLPRRPTAGELEDLLRRAVRGAPAVSGG